MSFLKNKVIGYNNMMENHLSFIHCFFIVFFQHICINGLGSSNYSFPLKTHTKTGTET